MARTRKKVTPRTRSIAGGGSDPPPPRPSSPIALQEIHAWSQLAISKTLLAENPSARIREAFLDIQHAVQRTLNPKFLETYNRALYGPGQLDKRRHFDPVEFGDDRELMVMWGVRDVVWPSWIPADGHFSMLAPFPIPLIQWKHRTPVSNEGPQPAETRGPLHVSAMQPHPQYILVCSVCTSPQGPRGEAAILNSKVPGIGDQLSRFPGIVTEPMHRRDLGVGKRLPIVVEYEVWGGLADVHRPWDRASDHGFDRFSATGRVLDQAMGLVRQHPVLESIAMERLREDLKELASYLRRLKCRRCTAEGYVRYVPQYSLPITLVSTAKAQADQARVLAKRLAVARDRISRDPLTTSVLWLPDFPPRLRTLDIAKRIAYARVLAEGGDSDEHLMSWLFTTWIHEQVVKVASWKRVLERLEFPPAMPMSARERILQELEALPPALREALDGARPGRDAPTVRRQLNALSEDSAAALEALHQMVLKKALEDFQADHG